MENRIICKKCDSNSVVKDLTISGCIEISIALILFMSGLTVLGCFWYNIIGIIFGSFLFIGGILIGDMATYKYRCTLCGFEEIKKEDTQPG